MERPALGFCVFDTEVGSCGIAWQADRIAGVQLPEATAEGTRRCMQGRFDGVPELDPPPWVAQAIARIRALLSGAADGLDDLPLALDTVPQFHQRVYAVARAIRPGEVLTYGEVARRLGDPGAARAVGRALGENPFAPVIPCHRVLAAGWRSGGFSAPGGARTKLRLLQIEGARLSDEPDLFSGG